MSETTLESEISGEVSGSRAVSCYLPKAGHDFRLTETTDMRFGDDGSITRPTFYLLA